MKDGLQKKGGKINCKRQHPLVEKGIPREYTPCVIASYCAATALTPASLSKSGSKCSDFMAFLLLRRYDGEDEVDREGGRRGGGREWYTDTTQEERRGSRMKIVMGNMLICDYSYLSLSIYLSHIYLSIFIYTHLYMHLTSSFLLLSPHFVRSI